MIALPSPHPRRVLPALLALVALLAAAPTASAELYRPPNMETDLFDTKEISLRKFDRAGLVSNLVAVARDFDEENDEVSFKLRGHALAIAGRLDPDSKKLNATLEQLLDKAKAVAEDGADKDRVAERIYAGVRRLLADKDNEANKKCAAYCVDIALELAPGNKYADRLQDAREELENEGFVADWKGALKDPVQPRDDDGSGGWWGDNNRQSFEEREESMPGGNAEEFKSRQSEIYGLVVITLGNGKHAGAASSIIATALRDDDSDKVTFKLNQKVGPMMANSLESIAAWLEVKQAREVVPKGYLVDIVFEDKDTLTDGPSAGTAMALLLESLFTGEKLDPGFACTGGITPSGKCTKIGGVAAKIRGATRRDCTIVGVPEANAGGVADILVLNGIEQLLDIQIFSMENIDQAREISRQEKSGDVQSTLDDFDAVASVIKDEGEKMLQNSAVQKKLEDVLEKMPNHLSAKLLLQVARDKAPTHLTVGGSFHEIDSNASGVFSTAQMMSWRDKYQHDAGTVETAKEALKELGALEGKVDERMEDYLKAALKLCELVRDGKGDDDEEEFIEELDETFGLVRKERSELMNDPELQEELRN